MRHMVYRFLKPILLSTLVTLSFSGFLTLAQEHPPLEIRVIPQAEYAVAGQTFTYTVAITNTGQTPAPEVIILSETPAGTTFVDTRQPAKWLVGRTRSDETDIIVWSNLEPMTPAQTITFELVVGVLPEMVGQQLINKEYSLIDKTSGNVVAPGLPAIVPVLAVAPTSTPSPTPTPTPPPTDTPTATASPTVIPTSTSTPKSVSTISNTATPMPTAASPANEASSSTMVLIIPGLLLLVGGGIIGLLWFFRRR